MCRKLFFFLFFTLFRCLPSCSQMVGTRYDVPFLQGRSIPRFALKNNILFDPLGFNLFGEFRISSRHTVEVGGSYNPFTFSNNKKFKHLFVQPELRLWLCEPFHGHFWGFHPTFAAFNVGNIDVGSLNTHRYEGLLYGGGFSYGYSWYLSPRFSFEATLGLGYLYLDYDRYECRRCGELEKSKHRHYLGVTRAALSLIYVLK